MPNYKTVLKKILGLLLILFGFIALLLPFVPFSWVAFFGFELLGIKVLPWPKKKAEKEN